MALSKDSRGPKTQVAPTTKITTILLEPQVILDVTDKNVDFLMNTGVTYSVLNSLAESCYHRSWWASPLPVIYSASDLPGRRCPLSC